MARSEGVSMHFIGCTWLFGYEAISHVLIRCNLTKYASLCLIYYCIKPMYDFDLPHGVLFKAISIVDFSQYCVLDHINESL